MLAVIFNVDDEAGMGRRRLGNQEILEVARDNSDVLIPFASGGGRHKGKLERARPRELIEAACAGSSSTPHSGLGPTTEPSIPSMR